MTSHDASHPAALASKLLRFTLEGLADFGTAVARGLVLPASYAGHPVGANTQVDLLYVVGLLIEAGITEVAGADLRSTATGLLDALPADGVEGFSSYRVAETVQRLGGLARLSTEQAAAARTAARSPRLLVALKGKPPQHRRNFLVVAARCLWALGQIEGETPTERSWIMARVVEMFTSTTTGWINDALPPLTQYDIYSPDMYLLAEPLEPDIGPAWRTGFTKVVSDLDDLAEPGGAVVWGRSVGVLSLAMTIEVGAVCLRRELAASPDRWLARIRSAIDDLPGWFAKGVVTAHQHRMSDRYRSTPRRLQLTLDVYGKLLLAASALRGCMPDAASVESETPWPQTNRLVLFDSEGRSGAWAFRSRSLSFALPVMYGDSADYLPVPRQPGLFDQPVAGPATMIPTVLRPGSSAVGLRLDPLVPSGMARTLVQSAQGLFIEHDGWGPVGGQPVLRGRRLASYQVHGRTLKVRERLTFDTTEPVVIALAVADTTAQPLRLTTEPWCDQVEIDTAGVPEWFNHWGAAERVQQVEFNCTGSLAFTWSLTRGLRIASTDIGHAYSQALYTPMTGVAAVISAGDLDVGLTERLRGVDVLHLAWPERWSGVDPAVTARVIDEVKAADVRVVWTQHNLLPHRRKDAGGFASYALWASAADLIIHHSEYGRRVAEATYTYGARTRHVVIPHGAWTEQYNDHRLVNRAQVEDEEGWPKAGLRLAVIGQPRAEKDIRSVIEAVEACRRKELHLVVRAAPGTASRDPRITVEHGHVPQRRFHRRMMAFDAVVLPFTSEGMLATGTVFDCIGSGTAAITSDWQYLDEVLDGSGIVYGRTAMDLMACIEGLTSERLTQCQAAVTRLRARYDWSEIARRTLAVMEEL